MTVRSTQIRTAEQLAEIAIQSADSAAAFGIDPRVAMRSLTLLVNLAKGADVDKVRVKRPNLPAETS